MKQILAACAFVFLGFLPGEEPKLFTNWLTIENLGPVVNSIYIDSCVAISKDGLSLYFSSTRLGSNPANNALRDLFVSKRVSKDSDWQTPVPLTIINSPYWDSCPALSLDEHRLYFTSNRPGWCGGQEIWASRRQDRRDDSWQEPVNLGGQQDGYVNSIYSELTPTLFEDESGKVWMYFSSYRTGTPASWDHYQSEMRDDDTFEPATPIIELNSEYTDQGITVRRDGLEVFFLSNRGGEHTSMDFWRATRASTEDPWSEIVSVPSLGNPAYAQGRIALSFDGRELYFTSSRPDGVDRELWVAKRERVRGPE